jgi:hypothetical protein
MTRKILLTLCLVGLFGSTATAQEWARKMFEVKSHDFGAVARGAKTEYEFVLQNIYEEDVHIAGVRASCGCTTPTITKQTLKTWEKGTIHAKFNTGSFLGAKNATLTVTIDKPFYAEVQLSVKGTIRNDVVFEPGSIQFGEVPVGEQAEQRVRLTYTGGSNFQVTDVRSANDAFEVELKNNQRQGGRVHYEMLVRLKDDAPVGYINDQLTVVTNNSSMPTIGLAVEGSVAAALTVSPASVFLGVLQPGQTVTKKLVVRGKEPFRILEISGSESDIQFTVTDEAKQIHLVPITFTAPLKPGKILQQIEIKTDLGRGETATCVATATVIEGSASN